jgi:regulator of ribosome biosynthesis
VELPPPTTLLPREKPLPTPRPPTRWELFAQRKGIQKRKRSKLEFDEAAGDWKRRHGKDRANDPLDVPFIEAKASEVSGVEDPFTRGARERKGRARKNESQQAANLKAAAKAGSVLPPTLRLAASLPEKGRGRPAKRRELHPELRKASRTAAASTASMGKFDRAVAGEKAPPGGRPAGERRKRLPLVSGEERAAVGRLADRIVAKNADDILDLSRAIGKFDAPVAAGGSGGGKTKAKRASGGKAAKKGAKGRAAPPAGKVGKPAKGARGSKLGAGGAGGKKRK